MAPIEPSNHSEELTPRVDHLLPVSIYEEEPAAAGTGKILIVDSVTRRRQLLRSQISDLDSRIVEFSGVSEALAMISAHPVDLVLLAADALGIGAVGFCQSLRKTVATRFLPIFILSEVDNADLEVRVLEAGASEFLVSPLRTKAFRARVQTNLRHKAIVDTLDDSETVLFSLAKSVEDRDPDLSLHCQRLALMSAAMGVALKLPASEILALQRGGYLHDIGKVSIPDRVLFKAGPLTPEEWEIMKSHAIRGEKICSGIKSLAPVLPIIRNHHERWDGSGYPDGLKGEDIPLLARILQLADIYDALTTVRPYKPAFTPEDSMAIIWEETNKGWRDPQLVEVFADILPMFHAPGLPDFSQLSLQALSEVLESFRVEPMKPYVRARQVERPAQIQLAG